MRIDIHSHFVPRSAVQKLDDYGVAVVDAGRGQHTLKIGESSVGPFTKGMFDVEDRIRELDELEIDVQVISPTHHLFMYRTDVKVGRVAARAQNEGIADAVKKAGGRLVGNATLPLQDPAAALEELRYAVDDLNLSGIEIGTNIVGRNLDDELLYPVWQRVEDLGLPVFVHPNEVMSPDRHRKYYSSIVVGTLAETTLAISSIIFGGVLDRFPRLKLIFAHGGGAVPFQAGRLEHASKVRQECKGLNRNFMEYLKMIHYDSVLFMPEALEYLIRLFSVKNVLLGTDYPFNMGDFQSHRLVESLDSLTHEERAMILSENAKRLYCL
ncbi:MAG: amidohydrolase family protein [Candidatus Caldarchaeum sp.]